MADLKIAFLAIFLCATVVGASVVGSFKSTDEFNFKSLSAKDRVVLHLLSKIHPKAFKGIPDKVFSEINEYSYLTSIDNFFVDARQLFTQAMKIPDNANHPEIHWSERYSFCIIWFCIDLELSVRTGDTKFVGSDTITTSTNFTPTSFQNTFHIPHFNWTSPGFTINLTDYDYQEINLHQNTFISFEDTTVIFQADYSYVEDIGIQLDNLAIFFDAGTVRWHMQDITHVDFFGNIIERFEPYDYTSDKDMMEHWTWAKKNYVPGLQYSLNCFLSNGRSDPEGCADQDEESNDYYRFLNMELIQTIGLGALLST